MATANNTQSTRTATVKKHIKPITFTITVTVDKVNENGTFSGCKVESVVANGVKKGNFDCVSPPQAGGAMYLKTAGLEGVQILEGAQATTGAAKVKLF